MRVKKRVTFSRDHATHATPGTTPQLVLLGVTLGLVWIWAFRVTRGVF